MKNDVGENNRGYLEALKGDSASNRVAAENRDREVIYQAIATQNDLGPAGFQVIESVFGEVQREKARAGESIQGASGEWIKKS